MATNLYNRRTMPNAVIRDVAAQRERHAQIAKEASSRARKPVPKPREPIFAPARQSQGYKAVQAIKRLQQNAQNQALKRPPVSRSNYFAPITPAKEYSPAPVTPVSRKRPQECQPDDVFFKKRKQQQPLPMLHGMANLGNTCYMSAVLQVLMSLRAFSSDMQHPKLMSSSLPEDSVYKALLQVIKDKRNAKSTTTINPLGLKLAIAKNSARFRGARQQDAHEFLVNLLDQVQEDVVPVHDQSQLPDGPPKIQLSQSICPTTQNFSCIVEHQLQCDGCHDSSRVQELLRNFSLDIPRDSAQQDAPKSGEMYDIQSLLQLYFQDETFEKSCEKCGGKGCTVRRTIRRLPRVLVLHLKRFGISAVGDTQHLSKKNDNVKINPRLNLDFCSVGTRAPIELKDVEEGGRNEHREENGPSPSKLPLKSPMLRLANQHKSCSPEVKRGDEFQDLTNLYHDMIKGTSPQQSPAAVSNPSKVDENNVEDPDLQRALEESVRESEQAAKLQASHNTDKLGDIKSLQEESDLERAILLSLRDAAVDESARSRIEQMESNGWPGAVQCGGDVEQPLQNTCSRPSLEVINDEDDSSMTEPTEKASTTYHLHAIIGHLGKQASFGHFVADIYDTTRDQWFRHDDSVVSPIPTSTVFSQQEEAEGYIFFYVHKNFVRTQSVEQPSSVVQHASIHDRGHALQLQTSPTEYSLSSPPPYSSGSFSVPHSVLLKGHTADSPALSTPPPQQFFNEGTGRDPMDDWISPDQGEAPPLTTYQRRQKTKPASIG